MGEKGGRKRYHRHARLRVWRFLEPMSPCPDPAAPVRARFPVSMAACPHTALPVRAPWVGKNAPLIEGKDGRFLHARLS